MSRDSGRIAQTTGSMAPNATSTVATVSAAKAALRTAPSVAMMQPTYGAQPLTPAPRRTVAKPADEGEIAIAATVISSRTCARLDETTASTGAPTQGREPHA